MKVDLSDGRIDNLELRGSRESLATQRASGWEILYRHPVTTWRSYSAEEWSPCSEISSRNGSRIARSYGISVRFRVEVRVRDNDVGAYTLRVIQLQCRSSQNRRVWQGQMVILVADLTRVNFTKRGPAEASTNTSYARLVGQQISQSKNCELWSHRSKWNYGANDRTESQILNIQQYQPKKHYYATKTCSAKKN